MRPRHHTGRARLGDTAAPYLLAVAGVGTWWWSLRSIHPYRAGALGLLPQLSILWWLGLVLVAGAVVWELRRDVPHWPGTVFGLAALALVLHGTLPAVEAVPRFSTAYSVAGFSDYLGRTGRALPRLDVRMSWPAMFAAAGMAARAMGVSTLWFLRWFPRPELAISSRSRRSPTPACARVGHGGRPRHLPGRNWIDQDYFSPQGHQPLPVPGGRRHRHPRVQYRRKPAWPMPDRAAPGNGPPSNGAALRLQAALWLGRRRAPETDTTVGYRVAMLVP